jgi:hypothetical protein
MANEYQDLVDQLVSGDTSMHGAVGLSEIVGAMQEIIGAGGVDDKLAELARIRAAGGVGVKDVDRNKMRIQPAAFANTAVTAATKVTLSIQPQRLIQIHSLVIPSMLNGLFDVNDIRVGQQTQFITSGSVPGAAFSEVADGERNKIKLDSADIGHIVAIDVTNNDAANTQTFRGVFFAISVF